MSKDLFWSSPEWMGWEGHPAIVLGNSPGVSMVDPGSLDKVLTFGVNRILRTYVPHHVLICDDKVIREERADLNRYSGRILLWDGVTAANPAMWARDDVRSYAMAPGAKIQQWKWPQGPEDMVIKAGNTPAYALQVAVLMGCSPIGVVGVDFNYSQLVQKKKSTHSYGNGSELGSTGAGAFVGAARAFYTQAFGWAKELGCDLINLTPVPDSPFNGSGWPKMTVDEFVEKYRVTGSGETR